MTVSAVVLFNQYPGNGIVTQFDYDFTIYDSSELQVRDIDPVAGQAALLSEGVHYTVTGVGQAGGGRVTVFSPPLTGHLLDLRPIYDLLQTANIRNQGRFLPEIHENALDRLAFYDQYLLRLSASALRFQDWETPGGAQLPDIATRKGKFLFFDPTTGAASAATNVGVSPLTQALIGGLLFPRTNPEIVAGILPTNFYYEPGDLYRYGAVGNGIANDFAAARASIMLGRLSRLAYGTYLTQTSIIGNYTPTLVGDQKFNSAIIAGTGSTAYMLDFGDGVSSIAQTGNLSNLRLQGGVNNSGILRFNFRCHLWTLNNLLFSASPCSAIVNHDSWDSVWTQLDILGCSGPGSNPATGASVRITGDSNNIYCFALRIERAICGGLYNEGANIYINGKLDNGFATVETAHAITNTATGLLEMDRFNVQGVGNAKYNIDNAGGLIITNSGFLGATGANAHINDRRVWTQTGIFAVNVGPEIPMLKVTGSNFSRTFFSINAETGAIIHSKIFPVRVFAKLTVSTDNGASGQTRNVSVTGITLSNNQYDRCWLVHNSDGFLSTSRRKIITTLAGGNLILAGNDAVVTDADYSIEYAGGHQTPNLQFDGNTESQAIRRFATIASGCTIATTGTYVSAAGADYGCTTLNITTGLVNGTDLTGYYLVDETSGEPFLIGFGLSGATIGLMYNVTARLLTTRTYSVIAGYYGGARQVGSEWVWNFAGRLRTANIERARNKGFDQNNLPLWGFIDPQQTVTLTIATGLTTTPSAAFAYAIDAGTAVIQFSTLTGTSNATTMTMSGVIPELRPRVARNVLLRVIDNGVTSFGLAAIGTNGNITLFPNAAGGAWTNTGSKGVSDYELRYLL